MREEEHFMELLLDLVRKLRDRLGWNGYQLDRAWLAIGLTVLNANSAKPI